jgi:hypothetical protein
MIIKLGQLFADVAELVDAPGLGSGFARSEGSSPFIRIWVNCVALGNLQKSLEGFAGKDSVGILPCTLDK